MDRHAFWKIIDDANQTADSIDEVPAEVVERLSALPVEEIISFQQHQLDLEAESYRWDLWAVAYIINGGCSDDSFDYFRAWLIGSGRKRFEAAMARPEVIGEWVDEEVDLEDMLSVANDAYRQATGEYILSEALVNRRPADPIGEPWDEDNLEEMYPELYEKFS